MSRAGAGAGADTPTSDIILPQIVPIPDTLDCLTHTSLTPHTSHQEGEREPRDESQAYSA